MKPTWCSVASLRKKQIQEGKDITFSRVFLPIYRKMMKELQPAKVLEVGCGTGHLSLAIKPFSKKIRAIEPSPGMYRIAKKILEKESIPVENVRIENYKSREKYDVILSHMCIQNISKLDALFFSIKKLLSRNGRFIFSIPHPCFYNSYKKFIPLHVYQYMRRWSGQVKFNITKDKRNSISARYHHRPLEYYFQSLKASSFQIANFQEVYPSLSVQRLYGKLWGTPRYLIFTANLTSNP